MEEQTTPHRTAPLMSREFLSADDAARYAHERVGERRDRQFLAMIFQREQRYVVTEPVEAGGDLLDQQLFAVDAAGRAMYPDKHVLHSLFYSHQALSTLDAARIERLKWTRTDAIISLQMFSIHELFHIVAQGVPAYLSGAEDSLLWFESDPVSWPALLQRLGTLAHPGPLAQGLEQGSVLPIAFVQQVASAGTLRIVIDNALWGHRQTLTEHWGAYPEMGERPVPKPVSFGAVFASADAAAQDRFARGVQYRDQERTWFGFILKREGLEEYIASELVAVNGVRDKLFSRHSLFPESPHATQSAMPQGFRRYAYFYSRQRVTRFRPNRGWLAEHFIVPRDLFVAVYDSRRPPVVEGRGSIPTYIATQDGALLKYLMRPNSKLFDNNTPHLTLDDIQSNLVAGTLSSTGFVRVVANSGELSVLHPNTCWDRPGRIDSEWLPARHIERRLLSAAFPTADDAALAARAEVPATADRIFGGLVLRRADGLFVATLPVITPEENFSVDWIFPDESVSAGLFPAGCSIVARYRSRSAREVPVVLDSTQKQLYLNMLSVDVVYSAFQREGRMQDEYLFGPDGSVIRYQCGVWNQFRANLASALTDFASLPHDLDAAWIRKRIHEGQLTPYKWVDSLARNGYLRVVSGSPTWGAPRAVSEFSAASLKHPSPPRLYTPAISEPRYSPAFAQEAAAARYAHERAGERGVASFGFILYNERHKQFVSTLPIALQNSALAYDRVFPEGKPLSGYKINAVYLCAARTGDRAEDGDRAHFFSPLAVHLLLARAKLGQAYKPVYLSCSDGALLRFEMDPFEPGKTLDEFGQSALFSNKFGLIDQANADERDIREQRFSLQSYIRRMARAGTLEVLVPSAFWGKGYVRGEWQPRQSGMSEQELWSWKPELAMGPVFHHPDDAARYIQQRAVNSPGRFTTYESAILTRPNTNTYCGLEPLSRRDQTNGPMERIFRTASDPDTNPRNKAPRFAAGFEVLASHQLYFSGTTLPAADEEKVYANFPSPWFMYVHTHALKAKGFALQMYYYSTPHGALIKYVPTWWEDEKKLLLTKEKEWVAGQWRIKLSTAEFISKLAEMGELRVLKAAFYWNRTGRLGNQWKVSRQQFPVAPVKFQRDEL
ncbi:hypothetical protein ACXR0M_20220 [Pseudomonas sp. Eth.TT006]